MTDAGAAPKPKLTLWVWIWAVVIFMTGRPFAMQLAGIDPSGSVNQLGKPYGDYLHYAITLAVVGLVVQRGKFEQVVRTSFSAPMLLVFVALAIASAAWSVEPYATVRAGFAFAGTVFCFAAAITLLPRVDSIRALLLAMSLSVVLSVVWSLAVPHYGQHDTNDIYQASHVGKWRGLYNHKNILGQVAGVTVGALIYAGGQLLPRHIRFPAIAAGLLCLAFAQSASGLLIAAAGFGFGVALFRLTGYARWVAITVGLLGCILLSGAGSEVLSSILVALGKSPTFSGRTVLWAAASQLIADRWLLGYGLASITDLSITNVFLAVNGEVHDAHNSYLELAIALGLSGLFLHLLLVLDAVVKGMRARMSAAAAIGRRALLLIVIMWFLAALSEAAPFIPGGPVEAFALFAVMWLSSSGLASARTISFGRSSSSTSEQAQLSVRRSGSKKGKRSRTVELD